MEDNGARRTEDVLSQEIREIESRRQQRKDPTSPESLAPNGGETIHQSAKRLRLSAVCLSGGGIRSAAFCLGVLQALAVKRMLCQFDYLSTVSGGGFIGGWLQVLIRDCGSVEKAEDAITSPDGYVLRRLRAYTNYLTPQTGPFSTDTWAGIVLYLRNLLINWAIFAPLFLLIALIPIFYTTAIWICSEFIWLNVTLLGCASLTLMYGVVRACSLLPSHRERRPSNNFIPTYASDRSIRRTIVYPALGWTLLIPSLLEFALNPDIMEQERSWLANRTVWVLPTIYLVVMILSFGLAWWLQSHRSDPGLKLFRANFRGWITASAGASLLTWLMLKIAFSILSLKNSSNSIALIDTAIALTVFAPLALAVLHVLQTSLYVALRHENELADLDREWLGRVNAMILRLAAGWTALSLGCLIVPLLLSLNSPGPINDSWKGGSISTLGAFTMLVGGAAAWLGKIGPAVASSVEKPRMLDRFQTYLPKALSVLFIVCLLVTFGSLLYFALSQMQDTLGPIFKSDDTSADPKKTSGQPRWLPLGLQALVAALLLCGVFSFCKVNVNRFSMHAVYRNRLTRAFLGPARNNRESEQDPFTGFDPRDNSPLSLLTKTSSLFPVINMTLNITVGTNTAWAERQAASFTATPLVCGSATLRHPTQPSTTTDPEGAFIKTTAYAGLETLSVRPTSAEEIGPGLGSALTVSGAAVSPNWGYHSSRLTAFLMTLFNVRLGIWLPNPSTAKKDELRLARPHNSLMALIDEMLGKATDNGQAIYLSDGGHFENLGVYEMLRRRASLILVVDAGADEACSLADLGNAIRKAEIDLGITVNMNTQMQLHARVDLEASSDLMSAARGHAFGDINYSGGHIGKLLYIKPSFLSDIPVDVRSYGSEHKTFPHESTLDQWFSESQFESYRSLGHHQMMTILAKSMPGDLLSLFEVAF